jgi:uncharacterized protein YjiS (DUF1127 family)
MSIIHPSVCAGPGSRPRHRDAVDALSDATAWLRATLRTWHRRARERDQLARLDGRMLKDIGVSEADRFVLVNKPFWRE